MMITFGGFIGQTVAGPWFGYHRFLELNEKFNHITGIIVVKKYIRPSP